jgi:SGNH hydrolase-like domain, acetyltransferase AlgX
MKSFLQRLASRTLIESYNRLFLTILIVAGLGSFFISPSFESSILENNMGSGSLLVTIFTRIRYLLGDQVFDIALAVKDHWFVYIGQNSIDDYQNIIPFTAQNLIDIQRKLDHLSTYLASKGIQLVVVIPPNKNTIYPEFVPSSIPVIGSQSRLDQIVGFEKENGKFKIMDLREDLLLAKNEHLTYSPCGTHWNTFGAYIAYRDIISSLAKAYPNLKPHGLGDYRFTVSQGETDLVDSGPLGRENCSGSEMKPLFEDQVVTTQYWIPTKDTSTNFIFPTKITTVNGNSSLPRLLMYGDSFSNILRPLLADNFSQAVTLQAYPTDKLYSDIEIEKPDVVIVEFTERNLSLLLMLPDK